MALALGALVGQGMVFDTTNKYPFLGYAEINFNVDTKEIEIPKGNWNNQNAYHALIGGFGGTVGWHYSDANLVAALTGGSTTTSQGISVAKEEAGTVPSGSPYDVTLTNSANCVDDSIGHGSVYTGSGANKSYFTVIPPASTPDPGEVKVASGVLTFNAADADKEVKTTYLYTNATGIKVTIGPTDTPSSWAGYLVIERFLETNTLGRMTIYAKDIVWTGALKLGATRAGHDAITREFRVNNDAAGDLVIYFD
jgi:hypothetical protein